MKLSWRTELPQWIVIAAMFAVAAWAWPRLPERIPIHWNFQGEVDGYGNKFVGLLLLPCMVLGLYWMFRLMHLIDPGKQNYAAFGTAFAAFRMAFTFFMAAVYAAAVLAAFSNAVNMTTFAGFGLAVLFCVLGNFMGKIRPNWFVGVRTPWTLSSKMSWNKTHRLAGWLLILMGLSAAALGAFQTLWMFILMLAVDGGCLVWMVVYSYQVYCRDPDRTSAAGVPPNQISESRMD